MQGDFTRLTFKADEGYRSVLLQQGRVLLDADWNEQAGITAHHDEVRMLDLVGRAGGPAPAPGEGPGGFAVVDAAGQRPDDTSWTDLHLTPGRYYVDGVLCEAAPPDGAPGWPLTDQPHLRTIGSGAGADPGLPEPPAADGDGRYALYLDVWSHHVTADEEASLLEPALGGPDTTTRERTVWQVRWVRLAAADRCSDLHAEGWLARAPRQMVAQLREAAPDADPCRITTTGGYQRLENQLYRVQVHEPVGGGPAATFLWSRENGSVVAGLLGLQTSSALPGMDAVLTLDRQGRDEELSFAEGNLVQVTSTDLELRGLPGFLARAGAPDGLDVPVTWIGPAPASLAALGAAPVARRWEGDPASATATATLLEGGIEVRFPTGGTPATGDYWLIPARTVRLAYGLSALSGTIDWPTEPGGAGLALPPRGPLHHITQLAVVARTGSTWTLEADCRLLFPPATELVSLDLVGGDGQEAMPGQELPEPVRVVVRNGELPVPDALVRFTTTGGAVGAAVPAAGDPASVDLPTGPDGVAEVRWRLDAGGPTTQTLTAQRLDDHLNGLDVEVVVTGRLSVAREVRWEPVCPGFAGTDTVQDALAQLATTVGLRLLGGDGQHTQRRGATVPQPVKVALDSPCGPAKGRVKALARGDGLVVPATEGDPTPDTLAGISGVSNTAEAETDADGVASFWWQPGFEDASSAVLELAGDVSDDAPVQVTAQLLPPAGRTGGVHITELRFSTGDHFQNDMTYPPELLISGIGVELDGPVVQDTVRGKPVVRVVLELPWPFGSDGQIWSEIPIGFRSVELLAEWNADGPLIVWGPAPETAKWLQILPDLLASNGWKDPIIGRFIIDGWAIVSEKNPEQHLNGHANAVLVGGRTLLNLPTDDEVTGGQFMQWFRLARAETPDGRAVRGPDVVGMTVARAMRLIEQSGLVVGVQISEPSSERRRGLVLRTDPAADTEVDLATAVNLFVSSGRLARGGVLVPDVAGMTVDEATQVLRDNGLTVADQQVHEHGGRPSGEVIRTGPSAGVEVDPASTEIFLFVSAGPPP